MPGNILYHPPGHLVALGHGPLGLALQQVVHHTQEVARYQVQLVVTDDPASQPEHDQTQQPQEEIGNLEYCFGDRHQHGLI